MNNVDKQYLDLLRHILDNGIKKVDRTGTGTLSIFDYTMRFDMKEGFPLLTSKKMFLKGIIYELIWFLKGDTNIRYLIDNNVHIWDGDAYKAYLSKCNTKLSEGDYRHLLKEEFISKIKEDDEFAKEWGELGPIYGNQWRRWGYTDEESFVNLDNSSDNGLVGHGVFYKKGEIDQIQNLINNLKHNPDSRRLMVSAWNVGELYKMVLPPCHYNFQCYTAELTLTERKKIYCDSIEKSIHYAEDFDHDKLDQLAIPKRKMSLKFIMRSTDVPLGLPYNIASYAMLLHILCREANMIPDELIYSGGDCHIYLNQIDGVREQLSRQTYDLPAFELSKTSHIDDLKYEDFKILNYKSSPTINFPLSN